MLALSDRTQTALGDVRQLYLVIVHCMSGLHGDTNKVRDAANLSLLTSNLHELNLTRYGYAAANL